MYHEDTQMRTQSGTPDQPPTNVLSGLHALIHEHDLQVPGPAVRSEIVARARRTIITGNKVVEQYPKAKGYRSEGLLGHLRFALKYEPVDLRVYRALFRHVDKTAIERWARSEPHGIYSRRAWYLYEMLTGKTLDVPNVSSGRYVDILDRDLHIVGPRRLITRQRVNDNLLGTREYCPLIRRTAPLQNDFKKNLGDRVRSIVADVSPAILHRAASYLYTKETKSSFAIEGESPGKDRTERFVAALGHAASFNAGDKQAFLTIVNSILDPRYAQNDWRSIQVYVGQTLHDYSQYVHFPCPKPQDVGDLMRGWMETAKRLLDPKSNVDEVCTATALAFGFVFIHPFEDGNGRIHRFLVHHALAKTGFTPNDVIFPVSAAMLRDIQQYSESLETFSKEILPFVDFSLDREQRMTVVNETVDLYRYFDATVQTEYLYGCIENTIDHDFRTELDFIRFFDAAVAAVNEIVDMPDKKAGLIIQLIAQNNGTLSKAKRPLFAELADDEIERIERAVQQAHTTYKVEGIENSWPDGT
jgi:hypothetical protein